MTADRFKYLKELSHKFPSRSKLGREIIFLESVLSLPKGPELFISDVHGEYDSFQHMLRNGSGMIRQKLLKLFSPLKTEAEIKSFATLIYYPEEKIKELDPQCSDYLKSTLRDLIVVAKDLSTIYAKRKIDRLLKGDYKDIILTLLYSDSSNTDIQTYQNKLLEVAITIEEAPELIKQLCYFIQRLSIHSIHIIGDIYDRGPAAESIVDDLLEYESVDIQWGNHDIVWIGAACGSLACIANVIRLSLRYGNTGTLEKGYGINLIPLASFALEHYKEEKSQLFDPKINPEELLNSSEKWLNRIMHKAISIIQFKLEEQLKIDRPEFNQGDQLILSKINYSTHQIEIDDELYDLHDQFLPTIDPKAPYRLTQHEQELIESLSNAFTKSQRLQKHVKFLIDKGGMYKVVNNCLLYHGCIPVDEGGRLKKVEFLEKELSGKAYLDCLEKKVREAYYLEKGSKEKELGLDVIWYLWCGSESPLFGKNKMATFERYFITDEKTHKEEKSYYYQFRDNEATCNQILDNFDLSNDDAIIINGHVPVAVNKGERPIKANGKLYVIDGGFSKAYQKKTGIAGYTLIFDHNGKQLISHMPFESKEKAIKDEIDILSYETLYSLSSQSLQVKDIDVGVEIQDYITDLKELMVLYKKGDMVEVEKKN